MEFIESRTESEKHYLFLLTTGHVAFLWVRTCSKYPQCICEECKFVCFIYLFAVGLTV